MSAIDRVKAHFDALSAKVIEVPEWETTVYATPVTIAERAKIFSGVKDGDDHAACVNAIITKAKDASGKPLFTLEDKAALYQHADASVLIRVAGAILSRGTPDATELAKS
jgi:hypothetical protein